MRILVVNWQDRENPQAGGAEIHLHEIFGRIARAGHAVTLLCGGWPGAEPRVVLDGMQVERVGTRADLLSMFETIFGDPARLNSELERIRAVTPERLRGFARDFLDEDNRAVLLYEPAPQVVRPAQAEAAGDAAT